MFSAIAGVLYTDKSCLELARQIAEQLQLPLLQPQQGHFDAPFVLSYGDNGLSLCFTGAKAPGPIRVDFVEGTAAHRRFYGGGKGQLIAKAVGLKTQFRPTVVDATAGLGQDGFVLATLGCQVTLIERVAAIFALLHDGLRRANQTDDLSLRDIIQRITAFHQPAQKYLQTLENPVDIIYLDPMFPEREKTAQVNKSMRAFQQLVGSDDDAAEVLQLALEKARYRVVIKRPRKAPGLHQQYPNAHLPAPGLVLSGKSSRYDIYPLAKMPG